MKSIVVVMGWLCVAPVAWADYQTTPGGTFDLGPLTSEFKAVVPDLEGCDGTNGTIVCRRLTGDFSQAERDALDTALAAHDPDISTKRETKRKVDQKAAEAKLKALGFTQAELDALGLSE